MKRLCVTIALTIAAVITLSPSQLDADIPPLPPLHEMKAYSVVADKVATIPSVTRHKPLTEEQLRVQALVAAEFKDAPIMVHVADAESGFNQQAKNPRSTAKGVFQILNSTWNGAKCTGDVLKAEDNIRCARILYTQSKTTPWNESKSNWGKYL